MVTNFIIWLFVKNCQEVKNPKVRERYGAVAGVVGILCNMLLSAGKIVAGTVFKSLAIVADGINNLSDASNSIITLIGFKLAGKPADSDHPYGHARIEYISGLLISFIIMLLGLNLAKSSFDKIITPEPIHFSFISVAVLVFGILLKAWMMLFNRKIGKAINSITILANVQDCLNDVIASSAVLISLLIGGFFSIQLDGYVGLLVSLFILYSGVGMINKTLSPLLGEAPDPDFILMIENKIKSYEGVLGIHDLMVHGYGPNKSYASVHVEVSSAEELLAIHDVVDQIERDCKEEYDIHLVVHLDPIETNNEKVTELYTYTKNIVKDIDGELMIHDFRIVRGKSHNNIVFDIVAPYKFKHSDKQLIELVKRKIETTRFDGLQNYAVIEVDKNYKNTGGQNNDD